MGDDLLAKSLPHFFFLYPAGAEGGHSFLGVSIYWGSLFIGGRSCLLFTRLGRRATKYCGEMACYQKDLVKSNIAKMSVATGHGAFVENGCSKKSCDQKYLLKSSVAKGLVTKSLW